MTPSFWIILISILVYGVLHSWLASSGVKLGMINKFGSLAQRSYRLFYNFIAIITLLPILTLIVALPDKDIYQISFPWIILTLIIQVLMGLVLLAGILQTGFMNFLGVCQLIRCDDETEPSLVVTGLYRWVRHPLYSAGLIFIWLVPKMTWNLLALNIAIMVYIIIGAKVEERKLVSEYGSEYITYREKTPMLIPGLKKFL